MSDPGSSFFFVYLWLMEKKDVLDRDLFQLKRRFNDKLRVICDIARSSNSAIAFKTNLRNYVISKTERDTTGLVRQAGERILRLIDSDGTTVPELSTGADISLQTITLLWLFLTRRDWSGLNRDMIIDLYYLLYFFEDPHSEFPDRQDLRRFMSRWESGLDDRVIEVREQNKRRIIEMLILKIGRRANVNSPYFFPGNITDQQKYEMVEQWWNSYRFHLAMAVKSPNELNAFLDNSLSPQTMEVLNMARKKGIPFFITPYYLHLLNTSSVGYDDTAIRSYVIYSAELVETFGNIKAWEKEDQVHEGEPNAAGWLLPDGNNIHRRYPEVAIMIPESMGRACGGLCASCQRMYDFQSKRLNFDLESLKPKETWEKKLRRLMTYFEEDAQLKDILITGGDALMSQNATLKRILEAIYKMALRKKRANEARPDGEKYAELKRVRLGSRLPAYLPMRVDDELVSILKVFKAQASRIGVSQFYIQTHFQTPLEVTPEAKRAIKTLLSAGWIVTNQLVFNVAASRRGHTAKLRRVLNSVGVVCYYTFTVKGFNENHAVFAPNSRSLQETKEEKVFGSLSQQNRDELADLISNKRPLGNAFSEFLKKNDLPFAGTDRNVLNLPAIGKSMTFKMVGITAEGKRVLKFDHDTTRSHSPIVDKMGKVYIVENKSIAEYLRDLKQMGENVKEYMTIWKYCEGETEQTLSLYDYPDYDYIATNDLTNFEFL